MPAKTKKSVGAVLKKDTLAADQKPKPTPPNWPRLTPLLSPTDLEVETLIPDQILLIRNLFTPTLCKSLVSFLSSLPLTTTPGKPKRGEAVRVNDRFQVEDTAFAKRLWEETALGELVEGYDENGGREESVRRQGLWGGELLGLNPNIRIYRYGKGQFFGQHCTYYLLFHTIENESTLCIIEFAIHTFLC